MMCKTILLHQSIMFAQLVACCKLDVRAVKMSTICADGVSLGTAGGAESQPVCYTRTERMTIRTSKKEDGVMIRISGDRKHNEPYMTRRRFKFSPSKMGWTVT